MRDLSIREAIALLRDGEVVALPTETVYGLAADATNFSAVSKIFKTKGRPSDNPLIVHIGDVGQVDYLADGKNLLVEKLIDAFWPGPLTIVMKSKGLVATNVSAGLDTIGLRMPSHPVMLELLTSSGLALAAPSANLSGKPSPTAASHVRDDLSGKIEGVVDGGSCVVGLESTVIDVTTDVPIILRPGSIKKADIERIIGPVKISYNEENAPKAPGMKYAHYAPEGEVFVVDGTPNFMLNLIKKYKKTGVKVGVLCQEADFSTYGIADVVVDIGPSGENLYHGLRHFDIEDVQVILSVVFDDEAVDNRVMKASKERVIRELED